MIARKSVLIILTKLIDGGLGYLGLFFIARYMDPSNYGIVSFAMGFIALFSIFANLGFPQAHTKRVSEGKKLSECIGTFLSIRLVTIVATLGIILISLFAWTNILGRGFETPDHLKAIYIFVIYFLLEKILNSFSYTYRARKEIAKYQLPYVFNGIVRTGAIVFVALGGYGALALAWTYVLGEFAHLLAVLFFFRGYPVSKPSKSMAKEYFVFAFPLMIVATSTIIMTNIDRVLIQLFWNSADVGYYFAAFRLSQFINLVAAALTMLIFPTVSKLYVEGKHKDIRKLLFDTERHLSMIVFPMVFLLVILAEPVAKILLSGWLPTVPLIQILTFYALFCALASPYEAYFNGINKPKINRNRILIMVVCNLILNILLIPKDIQLFNISLFGLGARGAAIATVTSYGLSIIYTRIAAYKFGEKGNPRIFLHAVSSILMSVIMYVLLYQIDLILILNRWYYLVLFGFIGIVIYFGLLAVFKEFTKDDFNFYLDLLNIRKMMKYLKEEFTKK